LKLNTLTELAVMYESLTDADIDRVARGLGPVQKNEKALGTIHSIDARRMWATNHAFEAKSAKALLEAKFTANSEEESNALAGRASYYHDLADLARDAFWLEAKTDIGDEAWGMESVGIRSGWMLVSRPTGGSGALMDLLKQIGGIQIGGTE
jgi:hypothetical protein